jgi:hypothetical protein
MTAATDRAAAGRRPGSAISTVSSRQPGQDATIPRWLTGGRQRQDLREAAKAGAQAADLVVRAQLDAGLDPDRIEMSAEKVLGDRFTGPTPVSDAFYDAYDETVRMYVAELRSPEMEAG